MVNVVQQPKLLIRVEHTKAKLVTQTTPAHFEVETRKNGLHVEHSPVRVEIQNRAFFDSLGLKSIEALADEMVQTAKAEAVKAGERYSKEGRALIGPKKTTISKLALLRTQRTIQSMLAFIPSEKPKLEAAGGNLELQFVKDERTVHWEVGGLQAEYQPYSLKFSVTETGNV